MSSSAKIPCHAQNSCQGFLNPDDTAVCGETGQEQLLSRLISGPKYMRAARTAAKITAAGTEWVFPDSRDNIGVEEDKSPGVRLPKRMALLKSVGEQGCRRRRGGLTSWCR